MKRRTSWLLPALLLCGCVNQQAEAPFVPPTPEEAARLRAGAAEVLFWSQEQRDANFQAMERLFPGRLVEAGARPHPLPAGASLEPVLGADADAYMAANNVAGLIVLQDGRVRLERYARGFEPHERWTSFSVAKSLTSTLVGAAVKDGLIRSIDDPITRYIPELAGSAYEGVTIAQVLTMTSGVKWSEDYTNPNSEVARMLVDPTPPGEDVTVAFLKKLPREAEPGSKWVYKTGETNLIGVLVARATGKPLSRYLSEKIWRPYGMESDAYWQIDAGGREIGGCCISMTLRDYARVGQFILDGGVAGGRPVLPDGWIAEATRTHASAGPVGYGYQWWIMPDGSYAAVGIFGQTIYMDPKRRLVVVMSSAWPKATDSGLSMARSAFIQKIMAAADAGK